MRSPVAERRVEVEHARDARAHPEEEPSGSLALLATQLLDVVEKAEVVGHEQRLERSRVLVRGHGRLESAARQTRANIGQQTWGAFVRCHRNVCERQSPPRAAAAAVVDLIRGVPGRFLRNGARSRRWEALGSSRGGRDKFGYGDCEGFRTQRPCRVPS